MIKTSKQLGVAQRKLNELENNLQIFIDNETDTNSTKYKMCVASFYSIISNLKHEIDEYNLRPLQGKTGK